MYESELFQFSEKKLILQQVTDQSQRTHPTEIPQKYQRPKPYLYNFYITPILRFSTKASVHLEFLFRPKFNSSLS